MNNNKKLEILKKKALKLTNLLKSKKYSELITEGLSLKKKYPGVYLISNAIGLGYYGLQQYDKAENIFNEALKSNPDNIFILNNLGMVLASQDKNSLAEKYLQKAIKSKPDYLSARITYANLKMKENKYDDAIKLLIEVYNKNKNNYVLNFNLANAYQESGDFINGKKYHDICLEIAPLKTASDKSISVMTKYTKDNPHLKTMEDKLLKIENLGDQDIVSLCFALGKAYEDIGNYNKSFLHLKKANDLKSKIVNFNIKKEEESFKFIKDYLSLKNLEIEKPNLNLIFIVGMPRSGTTLIEQILSSHKEVYGAGELNFMNEIVENNIFNDDNVKSKNISKENLINFQNIYLDKIKIFKTEKKYFVDKALLNFKWIGLLVHMFPNCKIINCTRNPIDTCLSNYKNSFASYRLNFSYDLNNLGAYYNLYKNIMNHWNSLYSNNIINFNYEELTEKTKEKTRELLDFCGLKWDENCLTFFKNKRAVATASFAQVRSPIYKTSVKSWEKYKDHLGPLLEIIDNKN